MLQFIFGRPASGKTYTVLQKIKELTDCKKESVLIVPEQFTFESEKAVLEAVGDRSALYVNVISFTRLFEEMGRKVGGISGSVLRESDKIVFMSKTLKAVGGELKLWGKYKNSVSFAKTLLDTVGEFKINAVTPEALRETAENVSSASLGVKLCDLALVYESYNALLGEKFLDPADTLTRVYEALKSYSFFDGKTVFLDSFKGFTGQQYNIIERIFCQADDVVISLTDDPDIKGEFSVYANIRKAIQNIESIAKSRAVRIKEPVILNNSRYNSQSLIAVERLLAGAEIPKTENDNSVCVCRAGTIYDEAEFAASTIRKIVRTEGLRYSDFVIIARDSEKYQSAVESACKRNGVSLFFDNKIPLSAFPICAAARLAVEALDFSTEGILGFHKTGLGTLETEEIADLENYTFVWNISGDIWLENWDMDVRGITADTDKDGKYALELERINILRQKAIKPLSDFKKAFGNNAKAMSSALVKLFEDCNSADKLKAMSRKYESINNTFYSDALKQSFEEFMQILDSLVLCFGDASVTRKEFADALNLAVSLDSVGLIPQTLDEVTFGSADRIRPSRPKVAFVLGANQGQFPKAIGNAGIFAVSERRALVEKGINISDNALEATVNENYLVYCNLCCASNKLFISYNEKTLSGELFEPASFVGEITELIPCQRVCYPEEKLCPETKVSAVMDYCRSVKADPDRALTLKMALSDTEFSETVEKIGKGRVKKEESLTVDTAKALYGKDIYMSATKLDTFNRCHFSFFCRYGLKAQRLKSADFNVLQRGTIVHFCLERIISEYKKGIADLDYAFLDGLCDKYIEEYLSLVGGFGSIRNAKTDFLIGRISRSIKEVVHSISDEMKQCDFEPIACELEIGKDGIIPPMHFPFDSGDIILNGSIDRVDKYNGYIRIIDYKTGSKSFKMPDILFGLNLQMLLYLYCIVRSGFENAKAGGILYKPAKRDLKGEGLAMNGLLPRDMELVMAMDKKAEGEFVPKLALKKDGSFKKSDSFISHEDFEEVFDYIERVMKKTGNEIAGGNISVSPIDGRETDACKYCDYGFICGIEDSEIFKVEPQSGEKVLEALKEGNHGN